MEKRSRLLHLQASHSSTVLQPFTLLTETVVGRLVARAIKFSCVQPLNRTGSTPTMQGFPQITCRIHTLPFLARLNYNIFAYLGDTHQVLLHKLGATQISYCWHQASTKCFLGSLYCTVKIIFRLQMDLSKRLFFQPCPCALPFHRETEVIEPASILPESIFMGSEQLTTSEVPGYKIIKSLRNVTKITSSMSTLLVYLHSTQ